jgi:hypothetical protein
MNPARGEETDTILHSLRSFKNDIIS